MNDCPRCDHQSSSNLETYQHWLEHRQQPPVIGKGTLVSVMIGDRVFTDYVKKTGDDPMARALASIRKMNDAMAVLLKPRWIPMYAWKVWLKIRK